MQAEIGDDGWTVEWVGLDIQIGADTLYLDAQAQVAKDENTRIFIGWRARTGLPLALAAEALGVSTRSITRYSNGREATPRTLALACIGWEALQGKELNGTLLAEERVSYGVEQERMKSVAKLWGSACSRRRAFNYARCGTITFVSKLTPTVEGALIPPLSSRCHTAY